MKSRWEKYLAVAIGCIFIGTLGFILYSNPKPLRRSLSYLQNLSYDLKVRNNFKPIPKDSPVVIIDIDDRSLRYEGHWPWPRDKLARLTSYLFNQGAKVVVFDIVFAENSPNPASELISELKRLGRGSAALLSELASVEELVDRDEIFAEALRMGDSVVGMVFTQEEESVGLLGHPLAELNKKQLEELAVPNYSNYISNIPVLQEAADGSGFLNSIPDSDGILRYLPLVLSYKGALYPSLSLEAVKKYLGNVTVRLITEQYGNEEALEGIEVGNITIPTGPWGRMLIPFRGPPYSVPTLSATDLIQGKVSNENLENKIVFVGTSATALGDLVPTAISPVFAGVEIHAQAALSIVQGYLPFWPTWARGVSLVVLLGLGLILACILPFLGALASALITVLLTAGLFFLENYLWQNYGIVLSAMFPIIGIWVLFIFNEVFGYLTEAKRRAQMKRLFGRYVPKERINTMLEEGGEFGLQGETKELTVLFSDIRDFTSISEGLDAKTLKQLLNNYLTPMTQIIFEERGTIDKYVGDMIMAFWGAPMENPNHSIDAVKAAFKMQERLEVVNQTLLKNNHPKIEIGIGINTGTMDVGDMGSEFRRAYTVLGDSVNLGSRIESLTKIYHLKILVSKTTKEKTDNEIAYRRIDRVKVKGKDQTVELFEPVGFQGKLSQEMQSKLEIHHKALEAYFQQKWQDAKDLFSQIKEDNTELYSLFLERIESYSKSPPPADWDGSSVMESK